MALLATALDLAAHGCSVIPVVSDGTKRPAVDWKTWQSQRPGETELRTWFTDEPIELGRGHGHQGIGVITGAVSGNLELLEVEGRAVDLVPQLAQLLTDSGMGELWARICTGWLVQSPSGGLHFLYRVEGGPVQGNTKLARRPSTPAELATYQETERGKANATMEGDKLAQRLARIDALTPERVPQVLVETRGEGGYLVTAPSAGRTHATGKPWALLAGGPATCPVLTIDERDALHVAASTFDAMPVRDDFPTQPPLAGGAPSGDGQRPGDDYNARATWDDILTPHGWQRVKKLGSGWGWVRPGKNPHDGISATTGTSADGVDRLYVFSTSTEFETEKPYSKFAAHALLEHGGDMAGAASALRKAGYGSPQTEPKLSLVGGMAPPTQAGGASYDDVRAATNGATVHQLQPRPSNTLAHTDDANALLLVHHYGDVLRHCSDRGRWYAWDGHVWAECARTAGPARECAKQVARGLPEDNKKAVDHKKRTLSAIGISAMLTQAASDERVTVTYGDLDAHPWELNTPGGIVDLRTGTLSPSDPAKLHTRTTSCTPDFDADRSAWLRFLSTTFNGDQQLIDYLQRLVGYSAVGIVGAHILPYCHGSGGNGKGVFLETCVKVLGGYATTAPAGFLMAKPHAGHETEIARLAGARMVLCSEVNDDDRFDEGRVKLLTGGDTLTARFMQQDHFTFTPTHQLWAMGNHQPHVRAGGRAFWRRLRLIPFTHEVPPEQIIDGLQDILAGQHGPAVLAWIVEGAAAYHQHGLQEPDVVQAATGEYALDQDTVTRFLDEMCLIGGGDHVTIKVPLVRTAYENWCHETGDEPVSAKAFGLALRRHGIESKRTKTARMYVGISLIGDPAEDEGRWR